MRRRGIKRREIKLGARDLAISLSRLVVRADLV